MVTIALREIRATPTFLETVDEKILQEAVKEAFNILGPDPDEEELEKTVKNIVIKKIKEQ